MLVDVAIDGRRRVDATDGRRFETPESLTDAVGGGFTDLVEACETLCFLPRPNIVYFVSFYFFPLFLQNVQFGGVVGSLGIEIRSNSNDAS